MWWIASSSAAPPCDGAAVEALVAAIGRAEPSERVRVVAAGWTPLCSGDAALDGQLAQIPTAASESWWLVELQVSVLDVRRWTEACAGGSRALSMATKLDPPRRRGWLWTECELARLGIVDERGWNGGTGLLVLPILAAHALREGGIDTTRAGPIVRALAGAPHDR